MVRKVVSTFGVKLSIAILNLLIVILLSRYTGATGKGEASLIITSISMIMLLSNMVGGNTLVYLAPRYSLFQLIVPSYLWSLISCVIAYAVLSMVIIIPSAFVIPVIILTILLAFATANITILLGREKILQYNLIQFIQTFVTFLVLAILFYFFRKGTIQTYITALYFAFGSAFVLSFLFIVPYFDSFSLKGVQDVIKKCVKLGLQNQSGQIIQFINLRLSYYILNRYVGDAGLGVYSNGVSLVEAVWLVSNSIALVQYARIANSKDKDYSVKLTIGLTRMSMILSFASLVILMLIPSSVFVLVFGREFGNVANVITCLAPGVLFYNILLIIGHYFSGTGKYYVNSISSLVGLIITVILTIALIHNYSIYSAGIIASVSYIASTLFILFYFIRENKLHLKQFIPGPKDVRSLFVQIKAMLNTK